MRDDLLPRIGELKHQINGMQPTKTNIVEALWALADVVEDGLLDLRKTSEPLTARRSEISGSCDAGDLGERLSQVDRLVADLHQRGRLTEDDYTALCDAIHGVSP